ncbi:MAG: prephenate dehydrogenase [Thermodesulfobacteriota bacterium]
MTAEIRKFDKIAIVGVGLIGGSLALILKEKGLVRTITGIGRTMENLETALELGIVDEITQEAALGVRGAELVVVCVPVLKIGEVIRQALPGLSAPCIITDVGSVKARVEEDVSKITLPKGVEFVPAHPVAGTEESGAAAAFPELFDGRLTVITPGPGTSEEAAGVVKELWISAGSRVVEMDAGEHDKVFALVSHLPHVIAYNLVNTVAAEKSLYGSGSRKAIDYSAGGFRDFTRIASSSPEMWSDICTMNREFLVEVIESFESRLSRIKEFIARDDYDGLKDEFNRAKEIRDSLD